MKKLVLPAVLFASLALGACSSDPVPPVSKGQQLQDLQGAYQNRAITDNEYEDEKEKILDQ
ncbi:MAG: hypothetical protein DI626_08080 [Micavibrio aeruginosavorus]|uniref:SHOCT domain-containing protein n=1 Tax=Micavibrio aeruginosavorus TaxID=349221 RepID=A0A2W4ZT50_9BACT|nr:MAG: hypothetical protein DI626_08080 [Micavibrio aeruginosavorus]